MKHITRLVCFLLIAATAFTLVGCHEKNETVMTVGDVTIPSGLYITFQLNAFQTFKANVDSELSAAAGGATVMDGPATYEEYLDYTYQGKSAQAFINENALEACKRYAWITTEFSKQGLELSQDELMYIEAYAKQEWANVKDLYEPSGAGFESYKEYYGAFYYKASRLFTHFYDKPDEKVPGSGSEQVADDKLATKMSEDYLLVDVIEVALTTTDSNTNATTTLKDEEIEAKKKELTALADRINKGEKFADVYKEYKKEDAPNNMTQADAFEEKTIYPESAFLLGKDDSNTGSLFTSFDKKRKEDGFAYDTAYVTGSKDEGFLYLVVYYDIAKDPYYLAYNRAALLQALMSDTYEKKITDGAATLQVVNAEVYDHYQPDQFVFDKVDG